MPPLYPITGIPVAGGQPLPFRQEVTTWANDTKNAKQLSLFLRALAAMQQKAVEDKLSFFQLAGIHAQPRVPWDGEDNPGDFCNHNLVTFPTWHRPYMMLFEQVLHDNMIELIISWQSSGKIKDDEAAEWTTAAYQFRLPYWDWARKQPYTNDYGIPQICTQPTWEILEPGGDGTTTVAFQNPLTGFVNPKKDDKGQPVSFGDKAMGANAIHDTVVDEAAPWGERLPWSLTTGVSRYAVRTDRPQTEWAPGINNWQLVNEGIKSPQWYDNHKDKDGALMSSSFADAVHRLFTTDYFDSWETFASTRWNKPRYDADPANTNYMSLEYIHNVVHNATGGIYMQAGDIGKDAAGYKGLGLGHMSDVPVAAFDPIFWLHHCNIDRLLAMWQTLNWDKWFDAPDEADGSPTAGLRPFHCDKRRNFWTSEMTRDWRTCHYSYDTLDGMPEGEPTEAFKTTLRERINALYPSTSKAVDRSGLTIADTDNFNDYVINIVYDRLALKGKAYSIMFYLGKPERPFFASKDDPNFIGAVYTFSSPIMTADGRVGCKNCAKQQADKVLSKAQVPLTLPLIRRLDSIRSGTYGPRPDSVGALDPEPVTDTLQYALRWYFVEAGGRHADPSEFPNTEIAVLQGKGTLPQPSRERIMPRYGEYKLLKKATQNRPLGYGNALGPDDLIMSDPSTV